MSPASGRPVENNNHAGDALEDQFASTLAALDEELAEHGLNATPPLLPLSPEERGDQGATPAPQANLAQHRLRESRQVLELLESMWPRGAAKTPDLPARIGRFEIRRRLGSGGFATVYLAFDPMRGAEVALKVPHWNTRATPEMCRRFLREAQAGAALDHPNLVPLYEVGEAGPIWYLSSAYCPGPTLAQWLHGRTVLPRQAARIVAALADGIAHMHGRGILHRDIKPTNVLLDEPHGPAEELGFVPRLTDFGLAKLQNPESGVRNPDGERTVDCDATRTGAVLGTPAYMAPEQAQGRLDQIGPATDVYALGVVLYELLAGQPPFRAANDVATLQQVAADEPRPLRQVRREVPRDLDTICAKCLAKIPAERYGSASDLADDLGRFLDDEPIQARRVGGLERAFKWVRRRRGMTSLAMVTLAALMAIVVLAVRGPGEAARGGADHEESRARLEKAKALEWSARNVLYSQAIRKAWKLYQENDYAQLGELLRGSIPGAGERDPRGFEWHYLWRMAKRDFVLRGHDDGVNRIAFSSDGRFCATASHHDRSIILWDLNTSRPLERLEWGDAVELMFNPDNTRLVAVVRQNDSLSMIRIYDVLDRRLLVEWPIPWDGRSTTLSGDATRIAGILDPPPRYTRRSLESWVLGNGAQRPLLNTLDVDLHRPVFSPDRKAIAVGHRRTEGDRLQAHLLDSARGSMIAALDITPGKYITHMCFSGDGKQLAIGTFRGHGVIWNLTDSKSVSFDEDGPIHAGAFDPSGSRLYLAAEHRDAPHLKVRIRDAQAGHLLRDLTPTHFQVCSMALTPDGETIALGGHKQLHLQALNPGPAEETFPGPMATGEAWAVAFSPKEPILAVGYDDGGGQDAETFKLWDPVKKTSRLLSGHKGTVMAVAYSPDGRTLATGSYDQHVGLWNTADGKRLDWLVGHTKPVRAVAFSPDGRLLASGGSDHTIVLWNVAERKLMTSWNAHERPIRALAFSPDGKQLASAGNEECTAIWDVETRKRVFRFADEHDVSCLAYSPDGTLLATGNQRFQVKLWDPHGGQLKQTLKGHTGTLRALAFSPDGRTLATGGEDKMVRLWSVATWEELLALPTEHFINGLAFDRTGKTVAAALHDGTVKIWSADGPFGPVASKTGVSPANESSS